jgi:photosystem II stability/assembly factor-like uncharacterized protein
MKILSKLFILVLSIQVTLTAQVLRKDTFRFMTESDGILGNAIIDILTQDSRVWVATGLGLNTTKSGGENWQSFSSADYIGKGGISALALMDETTLWIAASFDTLIDESNLAAGGGLSYTRDFGETWTHVPQPIDSRDVIEYKPTTTIVQNLTFDIAILDSTIWITSFGGGLRKSSDMGQSWQVVTTDGLPFSALDYLNHRAFSVLVENDNIWVGTAGGISLSTDQGQSWRRFTSKNQEFSISGNFVVALAYQSYSNTIWAATIETDSTETRAVSKSDDGGESWQLMLEGTFPHNFAFNDSIVYVAADEGLFVSADAGESWYTLPPLRDSQTGEEILTSVYFSAGVNREQALTRLWAGSSDGLAMTTDNGNNWQVFRSFQSTRRAGTPDTYAYPSPFAPDRNGIIRFQYDIQSAGEVLIDCNGESSNDT